MWDSPGHRTRSLCMELHSQAQDMELLPGWQCWCCTIATLAWLGHPCPCAANEPQSSTRHRPVLWPRLTSLPEPRPCSCSTAGPGPGPGQKFSLPAMPQWGHQHRLGNTGRGRRLWPSWVRKWLPCVSPCSRVTGRGSGTGDIFPNWLSTWDEQNVSKGTSRSSPVGNLGRLCAGWG